MPNQIGFNSTVVPTHPPPSIPAAIACCNMRSAACVCPITISPEVLRDRTGRGEGRRCDDAQIAGCRGTGIIEEEEEEKKEDALLL